MSAFKDIDDDEVERAVWANVHEEAIGQLKRLLVPGNDGKPMNDVLYRACRRLTMAHERIATIDAMADMTPGERAELNRVITL